MSAGSKFEKPNDTNVGKTIRALRRVVVVAGFAALTACATVSNPQSHDPWEGLNRVTFGFNDGLDTVLLKPAATVYKAITPSFFRTAVGNFFSNLAEPWVAINTALQFKGLATVETLTRFAVNSTLGFGGLLDLASEIGIERRNEDFGQTLGYWGAGTGPYLVLPFFGPSNVRDSIGLGLDFQGDPVNREPTVLTTTKDSLSILRLVNFRSSLLSAGNLLEEAALDKYSFTRDVYLQRRKSLVFDGNEPQEAPEAPDAPAK